MARGQPLNTGLQAMPAGNGNAARGHLFFALTLLTCCQHDAQFTNEFLQRLR